MTIELRSPLPHETQRLKAIFSQAFDEDGRFTELFFRTAYAPERCFAAAQGELLGALHWFDCSLGSRRLAYLYAIAVDPEHRSRGIGGRLIEAALDHLERLGYAAALLVPAGEPLRRYYERLGFRNAGGIGEQTIEAGSPIPIRFLAPEEYARRRRSLLPETGVQQEGACLELLAGYARLVDCGSAIAAVSDAMVWELLGDVSAAPGLIAALGLPSATVRTPGGDGPFAMARWFRPEEPLYLGLSFE